MLFLKAITNAKKNVYIQTPYFLPTESLVKALQTAALAKVDVRLMIPERSDSTVLRFASFSYITEMLRAGVKVYFYQPGILHSKTIIIDDELCSVGSTNFDFRSFEHNFEANAFIYDREVNSEMKRIFLEEPATMSSHYPTLLATPSPLSKRDRVYHEVIEPCIIKTTPETLRSY